LHEINMHIITFIWWVLWHVQFFNSCFPVYCHKRITRHHEVIKIVIKLSGILYNWLCFSFNWNKNIDDMNNNSETLYSRSGLLHLQITIKFYNLATRQDYKTMTSNRRVNNRIMLLKDIECRLSCDCCLCCLVIDFERSVLTVTGLGKSDFNWFVVFIPDETIFCYDNLTIHFFIFCQH